MSSAIHYPEINPSPQFVRLITKVDTKGQKARHDKSVSRQAEFKVGDKDDFPPYQQIYLLNDTISNTHYLYFLYLLNLSRKF
ncbi:unnamed protein product [Clavelina lepadiformis]|uniref:Uncharacterized protein n=1 Tax=Clavelina lepadiformis TaxID=159417 RepID=A0ABP0GXZ3_CLALP